MSNKIDTSIDVYVFINKLKIIYNFLSVNNGKTNLILIENFEDQNDK